MDSWLWTWRYGCSYAKRKHGENASVGLNEVSLSHSKRLRNSGSHLILSPCCRSSRPGKPQSWTPLYRVCSLGREWVGWGWGSWHHPLHCWLDRSWGQPWLGHRTWDHPLLVALQMLGDQLVDWLTFFISLTSLACPFLFLQKRWQ